MSKKRITIDRAKLSDILETESEITSKELNDILTRVDSTSTTLPHWLVVLLKVIAYAIGIILAGYGTSAAAQTIFFN